MFRLSWFQSADERFPVETNHSQFHGGWITDELAAIASLRLGVRIKAGSVVRTFGGHCDDELGCPSAAMDAIPELRYKHGKPVLPSVVKSVSIERLHGIDELHVLSPVQFVALIRAARQYQEALWVAETEPELAWLMLVSAIETAANEWAIKASNLENLKSAKSELCDSILSQGSEQLLEEISDVFGPTLQSTNKFLKFCLEFMPEAPEERPVETSKRVKWSKTQLRGVLNKLYEFRSTALHAGVPFPTPLCRPPVLTAEDLPHETGANGIAHHTRGGNWLAQDLPMTMNTFSFFVNGALNNWLDSMLESSTESV
jgi:hypothetical protein